MIQKKAKTILFADDDLYFCEHLIDGLKFKGYNVITATSGSQVIKIIKDKYDEIDLVILDIMMPPGNLLKRTDGHRTGIEVARFIKEKFPRIPIVASTVSENIDILNWFHEFGNGYIIKPYLIHDLYSIIEPILIEDYKPSPQCFIVHGHDHKLLYELKNYLQNILHFNEPIILREKPSYGKTIIEKFEQETKQIDIVFVLLTPDDIVQDSLSPKRIKRRARQNVIFELGYFYAKLQRTKGRVILLFSGDIEIPSDISGIVYVDASNGIESCGEILRKELNEWL